MMHWHVTIMRFVLNGQSMELRRDVVLARPREPIRDDDVVYPVQQAFEVASGYVSGSVHQPHGASAPAHPRIRHCPPGEDRRSQVERRYARVPW
jgi:hypothetical protein